MKEGSISLIMHLVPVPRIMSCITTGLTPVLGMWSAVVVTGSEDESSYCDVSFSLPSVLPFLIPIRIKLLISHFAHDKQNVEKME